MEWQKAKSVSHLYEANARILAEMKSYLKMPEADSWYFDRQVMANYIQRSISYYFRKIYPKVKYPWALFARGF
jgi:hypothetical protein